MGTFDSHADAALQLRTEGETVRVTFKQGTPATGQGTVSWNIPEPAHGCTSGDEGAYAGIVILVSQSPMTANEIPQDGTVYVADPSADSDLHTGDKIGNALVVGAIYECENKGKDEPFTTEIVLTDLEPNTSYYVAGYITDCQFRYHSEGSRAYSDKYGNNNSPDVPGRQLVTYGSTRIVPTTATGLVPGVTYAFDLVVDRDAPNGTDFQVVEFNINGTDVPLYEDLLASINSQVLLADNPPQSPIAPNTGAYFWDAVNEQLFQWDGTQHVLVDAIVEATDPTIVPVGTYWYDTDNNLLYRRDAGSPDVWTLLSDGVDRISHVRDPRTPTAADYWFDLSTSAYSWNGSAWCSETTYTGIDPSVCEELPNGSYWYDSVNGALNERNVEAHTWSSVAAITWNDDPSMLPSGTYWFDLDTNMLHVRETSPNAWNNLTNNSGTYIQESEPDPLLATDGDLWYIPSTEELFTFNSAGSPTNWIATDVLVWPGDPTDVASCDLWWKTPENELYSWDTINNVFVPVVSFTISDTDPAAKPIIEPDALWFDATADTLKKWDGSGWVDVDTIKFATDPTAGVMGQIWHDTTNNLFYIWNTSPGAWSLINTVDSANDPTSLPADTTWFDTTNNVLNKFNGSNWVIVSYTTVPLTPTRGDKWFDNVNNILYTWDGTSYVETQGIASAYITDRGQILFEGAEGGSGNIVLIPVPSGARSGVAYDCASTGNGYADFGETGVSAGSSCSYATLSGEVNYPTRSIPLSGFLWDNVAPPASIASPAEGQDSLSDVPSYAEIGVGDDGTPDERRELADSLRSQLGYPVVDVELTNYQIDTAITKSIETFRQLSGLSAKRGFYFLDVRPGVSNYQLTNKRIGYNKIVNITSIHRFTSAFLSTAHGSGVYGQVVLQHLYNMGTYDLTSFHLVSQYVEQLEHLFATRIVYNWNETNRQLDIYQSFTRPERLLLDCVVERTEQDMMKDRFAKPWIERYALSECQFMLAQIRGKFASLPGAGGGVSLNAAELTALAENNRAELLQQIDDYVANDPETVGMGSTFIIG